MLGQFGECYQSRLLCRADNASMFKSTLFLQMFPPSLFSMTRHSGQVHTCCLY
jgi:hypothetical protein